MHNPTPPFFPTQAGDESRAPLRGVVLPVVSAGAAGPAGAQAERAGARGKSAAISSFSPLPLASKQGFAGFFRGWDTHRGSTFTERSLPSPLNLIPNWKGDRAQRDRETFPDNALGRLKSWRGAFPGEQFSRLTRGEKRCSESGDKPAPGGPGAPLTMVLQAGRSGRAGTAGTTGDGRESACSAPLPPRRGAVAPAYPGSSLLPVAWVKKENSLARAGSLRCGTLELGRAAQFPSLRLRSQATQVAEPRAWVPCGSRTASDMGWACGEVGAECPEGQQFSLSEKFWSFNRKISTGRVCLFAEENTCGGHGDPKLPFVVTHRRASSKQGRGGLFLG